MRLTRFRGKLVGEERWIYGDLIHRENLNPQIKPIGLIAEIVYSETVGEYTGLPDRNGQDIYEGDKDKAGNVVTFVFGTWCLNGDRPLYAFNFEIAGNIHDNN